MNPVTQSGGRAVWGLLAAIAVFAAGCSSAPPPSKGENPKVEVSKPIVRQVTDSEEFTGHTDAVATVEVRARVTGYLDKIYYTEGKEVQEGDPLVRIDPRPYEIAVAQADAAVAQAEANLRTYKDVMERNVAATSGVSEQDRNKAINDFNSGTAALKTAKENLRNAQLNLEWTTVKANCTGKVGKRLLDPGNTVMAYTTPITTIRSQNPIYAYFDVDERTVLRLRSAQGRQSLGTAVGMSVNEVGNLVKKKGIVEWAVADDQGYSPERTGIVDFEDNQLDVATGTQRFRCVIANGSRLLMPGNFIRVRFILGDPYQALLIADKAIGTDQGQKYVFVVDDDGKVHYRTITVGQQENGLRVVRSGLKADERIVVVGLQRARDGATVDAVEKPMPTAPAGTRTPLAAMVSGGDKK
jgi:RND family efflux transporter MFP subunit